MKYSTKLQRGEGFFRQADREESLIHLLRVNVLKRIESSVTSFALTVERQLRDVEDTLARLYAQPDEVEEIDIGDIDIDDPAYESLVVGPEDQGAADLCRRGALNPPDAESGDSGSSPVPERRADTLESQRHDA